VFTAISPLQVTMAATHMNLSLLSRGVGEVQQNGHEKIEVKLEPEVCSPYMS